MENFVGSFGNRAGERVSGLEVIAAKVVFSIAWLAVFDSSGFRFFTENFVVENGVASHYFFKILGSTIGYYAGVLKNIFQFWF